MTPGFDANVPARKPTTKINRVISELASAQQESAENGHEGAEIGHDARPSVTSAPAPRVAPKAPRAPEGGREQIARLRERLAATSYLRTGAAEPKRTAAAVRDMVDGLRNRVESSAHERSEMSRALEEAQAGLLRINTELQRERRAREALEAQAEERRRIADDAVAEAEALAAERDQVLGELAEQRRLEAEQTSLLEEVETVIAQRDAERQAAAQELTETRELVALRGAEVIDLEASLRDEAAGRARAEARGRELEAEIARLSDAREALQALEALLSQGR